MSEVHRRCILLACGSFNPPTIAHFRMMEAARDELTRKGITVIEGVYSPVSSSYRHKAHLVDDQHRLAMLQLATAGSFMTASSWEQQRGVWSRTVEVLEHHRESARRQFNDATLDCHLVAGGDLIDSFATVLPNGVPLWDKQDILRIVTDFGLVIISRDGSQPEKTLHTMVDLPLDKVHVIEDDAFPNVVSSTRLRAAIAANRSIAFCTHPTIVEYIGKHGLYKKTSNGSNGTAGQQKGVGPASSAKNGAGHTNDANQNGAGLNNRHKNGEESVNGVQNSDRPANGN